MVAGRTGLVCHSDNPTQWARLIAELLRDRGRHAAMVKGARDHAMTRCWAEALQPLYRAYRDVVSAPTTAPAHDLGLLDATGVGPKAPAWRRS